MAIETIDNAKLKAFGFLSVRKDTAKSGGPQAPRSPPTPFVSPGPDVPTNKGKVDIQATRDRTKGLTKTKRSKQTKEIDDWNPMISNEELPDLLDTESIKVQSLALRKMVEKAVFGMGDIETNKENLNVQTAVSREDTIPCGEVQDTPVAKGMPTIIKERDNQTMMQQNGTSQTALAPALAGNGVQPRGAQLVPTLTGGVQPRCDPSETHPTPPAPTLMDLAESDYYKDLHVGMQSGETAKTLDQTKQHSKVPPIAPPAQLVPTLTRGAQPGCAPSEAHSGPPALTSMDQTGNEDLDEQSGESSSFDLAYPDEAPTSMDQIGNEDSNEQSCESSLFDLSYLNEAMQDGERVQTPDQTNQHSEEKSEIPSDPVINIPQTPILESATSSKVIVLPALPVQMAMEQNSNNSLETSPGQLKTSWRKQKFDGHLSTEEYNKWFAETFADKKKFTHVSQPNKSEESGYESGSRSSSPMIRSTPPLASDNSENNENFTPKEGVYCDVCNKYFLRKHMKKQHGTEKPYPTMGCRGQPPGGPKKRSTLPILGPGGPMQGSIGTGVAINHGFPMQGHTPPTWPGPGMNLVHVEGPFRQGSPVFLNPDDWMHEQGVSGMNLVPVRATIQQGSAGFPNPGVPYPGFPNPGVPNPGFPNPGFPNPGFPNPGFPNPGFPNPGVPVHGQEGQGMNVGSGNQGSHVVNNLMMAGRPISQSLNRPTASLGELISSSKCVQCREAKKLLQGLCLACFQKNELRRCIGI